MKVTATQLPITKKLDANIDTIEQCINDGQGYILTGEGSLSGYFAPPVINDMHNVNELMEAERYLVGVATQQSKQLLLGTGWMEPDGMPYNQVRVYDNGYKGAYNKRLLTTTMHGGGERNAYLPGWAPFVFDLPNNHKGGVLICNDIWATPTVSPTGNPYYVNRLSRMGVDVLFCSVNCNVGGRVPWDQTIYTWHENHLQMYARSFNMHIVVSGSSLGMNGEEIEKLQCPLGVLDPNGDWVVKLDLGQPNATVEIK